MAEGEGFDKASEMAKECPICYNEFTDPRLLDCSHTFCLKCLQELKQAQNKDGENIECPLCRKQTDLPKEGVDSLPTSLQGNEGTSKKQMPTEKGIKVTCQACEEKNEAISRCMDCEHYLCQECQTAHQRWAALRAHKIATLAELDSHGKLKDSIPKCEKHTDQDLCFYCNSCDVLICKTCTTSTHKKPIHFYESIDQAFSTCTQEIKKTMHQAQDCMNKFTSTNQYSTEHSCYRLDTMLKRTKIQVTLKAEEEIAKMREKEKQLKREAEGIVSKRRQEFLYATTTKQVLSKVDKVISTECRYKVLTCKEKLLHELKGQVDIYKTLHTDHSKSFLGFKKSEDSGELGTLLLEENWEKNGKIEIVKQEYVRMNKDEQRVLLEGGEVKIFNKEHKLINIFKPGRELNSKPTCLAVGNDNLIAVGYKDKESISLHYQDGSLIRTLHAPMIDQHLTVSKKRMIYTNNSQNKLIAIDNNGEMVFSSDTGSHGNIYGLCCDDAGDIYVAFHSSPKFQMGGLRLVNAPSHHISHYHAHGHLIESWNIDVASTVIPHGISFTPEGRLQAYTCS